MTRKTAEQRLAPVPREWLDLTMPAFRALVGAAFVIFSSYATVTLVAQDFFPILGERAGIGLFPDRYWIGIVLALGFFLGEVYTSERWPTAYRAILIPDTIYTGRQLYAGLAIAMVILVRTPLDILIVGGLASAGAVLVAYGVGWAWFKWAIAGAVLVGVVFAIGSLWSLEYARIALAILIALYTGGIVARFGELLLFSKRR